MIFLDSSFIISFQVEEDSNHSSAVRVMHDIVGGKYGRPFLSDYIFSETVTVIFSKTKSLQKAVKTGEEMKNSYDIRRVDESSLEGAWGIFKKQTGTRFSFADCTTIRLLLETGVKNIATFDGEFRKIKNVNVVCD
jgi:predicted nucleic acid-binding protein